MTDGQAARAFRHVLRRVRHRWFLLEWLAVFAGACVAAALAATALALVDRLAAVGGWALGALVATVPIAGLAAALALGWKLRYRPSDRRIARYIEERCPELEDRLATAADVLHAPGRSAFDGAILDDAARRGAALDLDRVVPRARLWRRGATAAIAAALLLAALTLARRPLDGAIWATRLAVWPPALTLAVEPGHARVTEGEAVAVSARVTGVPDRAVPDEFMLHIRSAAGEESVAMPLTAGTARARIEPVQATLSYRVTTGGLASPEYRVEVRRFARVARLDVAYVYPAFTRLAPRQQHDGGDVLAPLGTQVTITVRATTPAPEGHLAFSDGTAVPLRAAGDETLSGTFVVEGEGAYRVVLTSADGLTWRDENEYFVRPVDDLPPEVRVLRPGGDRRVTRLEEVSFEVRADDDHGVANLELVVAPRGGTPRVIPLQRGAPQASVTGRHTLYLEDFDVAPGDFLTYFARARDVARGKRATEARTDIFFLEVAPFTEEFEAAPSQAFAAGGAGDMDDLAEQQKDVVVATWKLQRREDASRSRADVTTVARAQATVRRRAEEQARRRMADPAPPRRAGRPGRSSEPGVEPPVVLPPAEPGTPPDGAVPATAPAGPGAADVMSAAVSAMTRAVTALDAGDLETAIRHEMDALNQLLRAAAEVRRKAIARQQQGGGRGGRSGNQDLSALFDRELQRQQETNYENRPSEEAPTDRAAADPLEQLRELARRQQDMERRERQLAREQATLPPEELKRRLERLTRDQAAVQRETERLARAFDRQAGQGGQPGARGAADALRAAADEMQRAGGDAGAPPGGVQAGAAGAGSGRASRQRALTQLREAERRAAGDDPATRARADGERRLELQELAEAQRRLGRDASAAAAAGDGTETRRLAGDQERLAARLDGVPGEPSGPTGRKSSAQQLSGRMRAAADRLRGAGGAASEPAARLRAHAEDAAALARELDRMAQAAGGAAADGETRRLSAQLARARDLRVELGRLSRRIGEFAGSDVSTTGGQAAGPSGPPPAGQRGGGAGGGGDGAAAAELARLQREFARRAAEARQLAAGMGRGQTDGGDRGGGTSTEWQPSESAPGTETFKQDFARWEALRRDVELSLDRIEASISATLDAREGRRRLAAGERDRAPAPYRRQVGRYFEALTSTDRP